jgi:hypothetical protein
MADEEDAFEERTAITKYERGFPLLACDEDTGPELPLQRSNDAAAQLSLSGRSFIAQHLDRFMGKKLHDVAN